MVGSGHGQYPGGDHLSKRGCQVSPGSWAPPRGMAGAGASGSPGERARRGPVAENGPGLCLTSGDLARVEPAGRGACAHHRGDPEGRAARNSYDIARRIRSAGARCALTRGPGGSPGGPRAWRRRQEETGQHTALFLRLFLPHHSDADEALAGTGRAGACRPLGRGTPSERGK